MRVLFFLFFLLILGLEPVANAQEAKSPWFAQVHTGSYSGALALGAGYSQDFYAMSLSLGYVPKEIGGEDLWSSSLRTTVFTPSFQVLDPANSVYFYAGMSAIISLFDSDTWLFQPSKYPAKYYPTNGIRAAPYLGVENSFGKFGFFFEVTMLDLYIDIYRNSKGHTSLTDLLNYGIGMKYHLD